MTQYAFQTLDGTTTTIGQDEIDAFASGLGGEAIVPDSPGYDEGRTLWNAMIDRRPGLIVECANAADVKRAVTFAGANRLLVSVMGAGHNIAGNAAADGGFMISFRRMKTVRVDAEQEACLGGPRGDSGRAGCGYPRIRVGPAGWDQLDHGSCRPDVGRRVRVAESKTRPYL